MLFGKKKKEIDHIDVDKELEAVISFLKDIGPDLKEIYKQCKTFKELRKKKKHLEGKHVPKIGIDFNLAEKIKVFDQLLKVYQFLDDDVEINKKRLEMIAKELKKKATHAHLPEELKNRINKANWWDIQ